MPEKNLHSDSVLQINLGSIAWNYKTIKKTAKNAETAAVVKANAYGLGVEPVSKALYKAGCRKFFVATLDEALELRQILKNVSIYTFHGMRTNQENIFLKNKITPILNTAEEITRWQKFSAKQKKKLSAVIHVDTGMNRLGLSEKNFANIKPKGLNIEYVMSHMASASEPASNKNKEQLKNFNHARKYFPASKYSLANSSAIFLADCYHFDLVRPGSALYGVNPVNSKNPMQHVIELKSKIIQLRDIKRGETIGYSATAKVTKDSKIAVVPLGYADGYLRALSNNGFCYIDDIKVPVIGIVSMDLITLDVSNIPASKLYIGKEVEIIGKNITVDEVAAKANTIGYEILTRLGSRFKRVYK